MRLNGEKNRNRKQQQEQQKRFVPYDKVYNLLHVLLAYFIKTLLYFTKFLSVIPVPLTTALNGSSAI